MARFGTRHPRMGKRYFDILSTLQATLAYGLRAANLERMGRVGLDYVVTFQPPNPQPSFTAPAPQPGSTIRGSLSAVGRLLVSLLAGTLAYGIVVFGTLLVINRTPSLEALGLALVATISALIPAGTSLITYFTVPVSTAEQLRQTLCRRCGYILCGISEPRCPECGERI